MSFVLDASMTLAAFLPDELDASAAALMQRLQVERANVPALWAWEVGNSLLMARRRGRIDDAFLENALEDMLVLPVDVDRGDPRTRLAGHVSLARRLNLTVYDATYVELARRLQLPLATCDKRLRSAARKAGIALIPQ